MSQQQSQQTQSPYPTWPQTKQTQQTQQPNDTLFPPAKRQRMSPSPSSPAVSVPPLPYADSPYATSSPYQNINLPNNNFNRPQPLGGSPITSNTMAPPVIPPRIAQTQTANVMGPPQRPMPARQQEAPRKEKDFDINDMMDLAANIDLEAEERVMASNNWRNSASATTAQHSTRNTLDLLSQQSFGVMGANRATGVHFSQEEAEERKHRSAVRAAAEAQQHHLENPFLWGNGMRRRIEKVAGEIGVLVPLDGLFDRVNHNPLTNPTAPSVLNRNSPLEPMLSLLSLATNQRIRGLLEDSYGLARGRQLGTDGVVPPEWADLAVGDGAKSIAVEQKSITGTSWEKGHDGVTSIDGIQLDGHLPTPPATDAGSPKPVPQSTLAFNRTNSITATLAALSRQDRQAEEKRMQIRADRKAKKAAQAAAALSTPGSAPADGAAPVEGAAPVGMLGEKAPEIKMSKKAREAMEKSARADMSEEIQTRSANQTASMQLGGRQYSWMSKGKGVGAPARAVPGRVGTPGNATTAKIAGPLDPLAAIKDRKYGHWREDGIGGRGVQLRDWIGVLEQDGREKKTLIRAYTRQGAENVDGTTSTIMTAEAATQAPNNLYTQTPTQSQAMSQEQNNIYGSRPGTANGTPVSATANFSTPWTATTAPRPPNAYASSPHPTPGLVNSAQNMSLQLPGQQRQGQAGGVGQGQIPNPGQSPATTSSQPGSAPMSRGPSGQQQQQQQVQAQNYQNGTTTQSQTQSSQGVTPAPPTQNGVAVS